MKYPKNSSWGMFNYGDNMAIIDNVYGLTYKAAQQQMQLLVNAIRQQQGKGFESPEQLIEWAHNYHLDKVLFHNMSHKFMCVSHKGEIMQPSVFEEYYGSLLFYVEQVSATKTRYVRWHPQGFEFYDKAYIASEQSDGTHRPLYYRDYNVPTGFFSEERDAFNVAKPFPVFAANTGRDTSHIYTYIEHVAGECAMHLLAWLRAKMLYPNIKTQVVPIIVSRAQGSGKTTFAEVICKGLFGKDNVLVTDQYDSQARFNADYADALIVCQEEKEEVDKRNPAGALKSRATATTIRKEMKGIDPIYQDSYTDFIMTTNKDVPIKFDGREDQRRFMIMTADEHFTRKESALADEVFTKLYGFDANFNQRGTPFVDDIDLIAQFKHELFTRQDIANVKLRDFPKTAAYKRCFSLPRTSEATEIEGILRALAPFIKASLEQNKVVTEIGDAKLSDVIQYPGAVQYMPAYKEQIKYVALCRPLVFYEMQTMRPYTHSVVERAIYDCGTWLRSEFGIDILPDMEALPGGFTNVAGRYKAATSAKFCMAADQEAKKVTLNTYVKLEDTAWGKENHIKRVGERLRVNSKFKIDPVGCFETVNEMKPGTLSLTDKTKNVQYMDTFLLESDTPTKLQQQLEEQRAEQHKDMYGEGSEIRADELYKERLSYAFEESVKLFDQGIVARIVYSGAKSYHLLIRVKDAPTTLDEYKWLHSYLCQNVSSKLVFDESTADPARLTRSDITQSRITSAYGLLVLGEQKLIHEDWGHVYNLDWRPFYVQWLGRPLKSYEQRKGKPLYPTRQEYREALEAIIDGVFWSDAKFDGDRQRLFFPAYRLLRALGYTHDEAWNNVIIPQLSSYKKQNEINYWRTRESSAIIAQIDQELDAFNEEIEGDENE